MHVWYRQLACLLSLAGLFAASARAEPRAADWQEQSAALTAATVTVRVWLPAGEATGGEAPPAAEKAPPAVSICSGVCVAPGLVVTSARAGSDSKIRLTLVQGKQATARLRAIDEHSGLSLLTCEAAGLKPLECAVQEPSTGNWVLTAAAWGTEQPVVSLGIVAGVDRTLPGATYPPLLQCDVRTTATSAGAAVIDREGKLVGVLVAVEPGESRRGWAYAVPVSHVQRLLRAVADGSQDKKTAPDDVILLKRRRPVVGMVLTGQEDAILVQRLTPGGPADKAGLRIGDRVLAVNGVAIRSVYQAVLPTLYQQPGDKLAFRIERPTGVQTLEVVLGGGVEVSAPPLELLGDLIQPKVEVGGTPRGGYYARQGGPTTAEVSSPPLPAEPVEPQRNTAAEKIALLEKALERYQSVIEIQQRQLADSLAEREKTAALLRSLEADLARLRRELK